MSNRRAFILAFSASIFSALILILFARYGDLWTDEGWSFAEAVFSARGLKPYIDFFAHRLPLHVELYGIWYKIFGENLLIGRILSVILSVIGIGTLTYAIGKCVNSIGSILIGLCFFFNITTIYALATATTYALSLFLFGLSCLVLVSFRNKLLFQASLFLFLQGLIWSFRYPADIQIALIILFLLLSIYSLNWKNPSNVILIICASIGPAYALKSLWGHGDSRILFDTLVYNYNQIPQQIKLGILQGPLTSRLFRMILMRKIELISFYPIIVTGFIGYLSLIPVTFKAIPNWLHKKQANLLIYCSMFVGGYYFFYVISSSDFPVTKVYLIPGIAVLITFASDRFLKMLSRLSRITLVAIIVLTLLFWPYIQVEKKIHRINNGIDDLNNTLIQLEKIVPRGAYIFTFNPLFLQGGYDLERGVSLELYSLLHNLSDERADFHHLITPSLIDTRIRSRKYDAILLEENRFFKDNSDMIKIISPHRQQLIESIQMGYELKGKIETNLRGLLHVYVRKVSDRN